MLWSDIINRRDGKLFNSKYPIDNTKRFMILSSILYFLLNLSEIPPLFIANNAEDDESQAAFIIFISDLTEPFMMLLIAGGWLFFGIRLQLHIYRVRFQRETERRMILIVNASMFLITASFLTRACLVLISVFDQFPEENPVTHFNLNSSQNYLYWTLGIESFTI